MKRSPAILDQHPPATRKLLMQLRALILETAKETEGVGAIEEALRWGQLSFLTTETGSGSTIRIDALRNDPTTCAMYFNCQSGLIANFRERYATKMKFIGERSIAFSVSEPLPQSELKHCISLALTLHMRKNLEITKRKRI